MGRNVTQSICVCNLNWCRHSKVSFPLLLVVTEIGKILPLGECIWDMGDPQFSAV